METRQPCRPAGIFGRSQPACLTFLWLVTSFCSHCRHAVDPTELQMSQSARKFKAIRSSSSKQLCCVGLEKSYDWRPEGLPGILSRFPVSCIFSQPLTLQDGAVLITLLIDAKTRRNLIQKIGSECVLRGDGQFISGSCRWCIDHHGGTGVTAQAEETHTEY